MLIEPLEQQYISTLGKSVSSLKDVKNRVFVFGNTNLIFIINPRKINCFERFRMDVFFKNTIKTKQNKKIVLIRF